MPSHWSFGDCHIEEVPTFKTKLSPAQIQVLLEVVRIHKVNSQKFECVSDYKPALKLIKLGLVKVEQRTSRDHVNLLPTPEGEIVATYYESFMPSPKAKLSPAQVKTLLEVIRMHKAGFRKFSCVPDYKPAVKLIELGFVKVETQTAYYGHMTLVPTPEGEFIAGSYGTSVPSPSKA